MNFSFIKTKTTAFWLILLLDLFLVVGWGILVWLIWGQVGVEKNQTMADNHEKTISYSVLSRFIDSTLDQQALVSSAVVTTDTANDFVDQLTAVAETTGVELKINRIVEKDGSLDVALTASGSFNRALHFLKLIEKLPYRLKVNQESLSTTMSDAGGAYKITTAGSRVDQWRAEIGFKVLSYHQ